MSIRVLLADDHKILRSGVRLILEQEPDLEVVAEADNGLMAVQAACETTPDVVVMDLTMPELNGIDATRRIKERLSGTGVLILSVHIEKRYIIEALKVGAAGFLPKECASDELITAIRTVAAGETYLSPKVAGIVVDNCVRSATATTDEAFSASQLSSREREVLQHVAEGKNTKEIGFLLKLSGKTVDTYRLQIMRRLDLHSIAELTRFAIREGITPP
jgi:DNA-binding NarL/FixJ family response regulator